MKMFASSFLHKLSAMRWKGREVRRDTVVNIALFAWMLLLFVGTLLYYTVLR